jgi:hypothetical protein
LCLQFYLYFELLHFCARAVCAMPLFSRLLQICLTRVAAKILPLFLSSQIGLFLNFLSCSAFLLHDIFPNLLLPSCLRFSVGRFSFIFMFETLLWNSLFADLKKCVHVITLFINNLYWYFLFMTFSFSYCLPLLFPLPYKSPVHLLGSHYSACVAPLFNIMRSS